MNLHLLVALPVVTALFLLLLRDLRQIRLIALIGSIVQLGACCLLLDSYLDVRAAGITEPVLFKSSAAWFPSLGISFTTGVDGISLAMILLSALVVLAGVLVSWNTEHLPREYFFLLMLLSAGAYGFFISLDLFTMFFFLEVAVIPKFLLIGVWGSGRKDASALKLALMLMAGSALVFVGMLGLYFNSADSFGAHTFDLETLSMQAMSLNQQLMFFPLLFIGFGIFGALFPFHTWVPDGHSSAPTAASMFLAGISMKLGGYGCLRVAAYLMPEAANYYAPVIITLAAIAVLYGAFATLMQTDLKYINAYSSVSHCGFVLLGIGMLNQTAITGAILQMVSHGLMTALFFAAIGMLYQRTHTRMVSQLGGLLRFMPFISTVFVIAGLCSLGLPGLSGFVAEMTVFMGAWEKHDTLSRVATIASCASIVVTAVYILRATGKVIFGPVADAHHGEAGDACWNEKLAAGVLLAGILIIGITPFLLTQLIQPDIERIMFNIGRDLAY
ncbi:MAG: NuoM family protein [Bacteroidota bacterium]|jgi:NADH-quinone oxidoreductase subunit M